MSNLSGMAGGPAGRQAARIIGGEARAGNQQLSSPAKRLRLVSCDVVCYEAGLHRGVTAQL